MSLIRRPVLLLLLAGVWGAELGETTSARAETGQDATVEVTLGFEEARAMAQRALQIGRPDLAANIARQMIAERPDDSGAHMLLVAALSRGGAGLAPEQGNEAVKAGRRAFRLSRSDDERFEAAYLTAEAFATWGRPGRAKWWLRRAQNYAPGPEATEVLRAAFGKVDAQSPMKLSFSFTGGPSSNVNGGSEEEYFWFGNIPIPIAQALPGWLVGSKATLSYRLSPQITAQAVWSHKSVFLNSEARRIDPGARNSDFQSDDLELSLRGYWPRKDGSLAIAAGFEVGGRWLSGQYLSDHVGGEVTILKPFGATVLAGLTLSANQTSYPDRPVADSLDLGLAATLKQMTTAGHVLDYRLGVNEVDSDAAGVAYRGVSLDLGFTPKGWLDNVGLDFAAGVQMRDYWKTPIFDPDLSLNLSAEASFTSMDTWGFVPTVSVVARRTLSDVVVRDTMDLGLSVGLSSSF